MTLKFAKRLAAQILNRGESAIRIKETEVEEASKAITREDIKRLVQNGSIFALKMKHNISRNAKELRKKRAEGRRRGFGRRKGTMKARGGITWEKKVRSQRMLLHELKDKLESKDYMRFYKLIKGNAFANKASLLLHMKDEGIKISDEELKGAEKRISDSYK